MSDRATKGAKELIDELIASIPKDGQRWGKWRFRASNHTLEFEDFSYDINLDDFTTAGNALDWIAHIEEKAWATSEDLGDLIRALDALLDFRRLAHLKDGERFNASGHLDKYEIDPNTYPRSGDDDYEREDTED